MTLLSQIGESEEVSNPLTQDYTLHTLKGTQITTLNLLSLKGFYIGINREEEMFIPTIIKMAKGIHCHLRKPTLRT